MRSPIRYLLVVLSAVLLSGCRDQVVYTGLSQRDAFEMLLHLEASGFNAKIVGEGRSGSIGLSVPSNQVTGAARVLASAGLPREKLSALPELLPKDSYMASPAEDRARLAYGTSQEITSTLQQMAGISHARVHIALAEKNALGQVTTNPSASVVLRFNPSVVKPDMPEVVRALVAHSVPGLAHERVSVSMIPDTASLGARASDTTPMKQQTIAQASVGETALWSVLRTLLLSFGLGGLAYMGAKRLWRQTP